MDQFHKLMPPLFSYTPVLMSTGEEMDIWEEGWDSKADRSKPAWLWVQCCPGNRTFTETFLSNFFQLFSYPRSSLCQIPVSLPLWLFSGCIVFTSPVCDGLAPIYSCNRLICEEGPVIREVPESTMASQPWEQNATQPWIFMLRVKNKASLSKRHIHCDGKNILLLVKVPEYGLWLKLAAKLSQS